MLKIISEFEKINNYNDEPIHFVYDLYIKDQKAKIKNKDETNEDEKYDLDECLENLNLKYTQLTFKVCNGDLKTYLYLIDNVTISEIVLLSIQQKLLVVT
ncbi:MAG: hypothetical protein ABFC34_13985 [Methanobacterium sp.]